MTLAKQRCMLIPAVLGCLFCLVSLFGCGSAPEGGNQNPARPVAFLESNIWGYSMADIAGIFQSQLGYSVDRSAALNVSYVTGSRSTPSGGRPNLANTDVWFSLSHGNAVTCSGGIGGGVDDVFVGLDLGSSTLTCNPPPPYVPNPSSIPPGVHFKFAFAGACRSMQSIRPLTCGPGGGPVLLETILPADCHAGFSETVSRGAALGMMRVCAQNLNGNPPPTIEYAINEARKSSSEGAKLLVRGNKYQTLDIVP